MSTSITAAELKSALAGRQPPLVIDVRRSPAFHAAPDMAAGALRRDPGAVAGWAKTLPRAASVVTYCVHGHEVSQNAAKALREIGIAARYPGGRAGGGLEGRRRRADRQAGGGFHALGHARAPEDRPHRLPVARLALHRSRSGIPLCAAQGGAARRQGESSDSL